MGVNRNFRIKVPISGLLAVFFFISPVNIHRVYAETLLSLEEAIDIALEQGYDMKTLRLQVIEAEENRLAAKYRFRTNADISLNTPNWSENVREVQVPNGLPVYNSLGTMRYQGQLNINQPLPTDGTITLRSQLYQSKESNYFTETDETLKRKDFVSSLSLRLSQPLFTYNRLKTGLQRAELNYERTSLNLNRTELNVIYNVSNSFYTLYRLTRSYEIANETMEQQKKTYDLAKLKFEAGLIPEVDALRTEVDLASAQSDLLSAEASMERQKEQFKQDIGLSLDEDVGVKTDISYAHFDIDLDKALEYGLANRYEIRENEINISIILIGCLSFCF